MERQAIISTLKAHLSESFASGIDIDSLATDQSLVETGVLDSAAVLPLILFLEEEFEISFDDDDVVPENVDSLDGIANFVLKQQIVD